MSSYTLEWKYAVPLFIVLFGYRARFLNLSGSCSALLVGSLVVEAGWDVAGQLIIFFLLGSIATKLKHSEKEAAMPYPETIEEEKKRSPKKNDQRDHTGADTLEEAIKKPRAGRDMYQVFATGLIPALICAFRDYFPSMRIATMDDNLNLSQFRSSWYLAYLAYVACCCGDTLASEIGMLSTQTPIMLIHKKKVRKGVDGGMTLLGTCASVVGGCIVGAFGGSLFDIYLGGLYGCIGGLIDSLLGAVMQSREYGKKNNKSNDNSAIKKTGDTLKEENVNPLEFIDATQSHEPLSLTPSQWKQLNNIVNLLSSILTAILALIVQYILLTYGVDLLPSLNMIAILLLLTLTPSCPSWMPMLIGTVIILGIRQYREVEVSIVLAIYTLWRTR